MSAAEAPNRATLALVYSELGNLRGTIDAGFQGIQRQLDAEDEVTKAEVQAAIERIEALEKASVRSVEWKRGPLLLLAGALVVAGINLIPAVLRALGAG